MENVNDTREFIIKAIGPELSLLGQDQQKEILDYIYKHPSNYFRKLDTLATQKFEKVDKCNVKDFFVNGYNGKVHINMKDGFIEHILEDDDVLLECDEDTLTQYHGRNNYIDSQVWLRLHKPIPMTSIHFLARIKSIIEHDLLTENKFLDFSKHHSFVFFGKSKKDSRICAVRVGYGRLRNHERNNLMEIRFSSHKFDVRPWEKGTIFVSF